MLHQIGSGVKFIKDYNELNVLRYIKNNAPCSRAEISKKYHISKAAVSDIIARLIQQGYVSERGVGNSTKKGGRRPIMLRFNNKAGFVIAVEIKRSHARVALVDLEADIHELKMVQYPQGSSFETVIKQVFPVIHALLKTGWIKRSKPIGIGIGIPGIIDYDLGCIRFSDTMHKWESIPIRDLFYKEFGTEVVIENDVKTLTLGECLFGQGKSYNNLVNLWIGDGIGAGIIINGSLIRGVTASAGEVGYDELGFFIREKESFPLLYKDQKDFGDILSYKLLLDSARMALQNGHCTSLCQDDLNLEKFIEAANSGDKLALDLLTEYTSILGILCINLINTLNIELLIISGKMINQNKNLLPLLRKRVQKDILREPAQAVKIVPSALHEEGVVKGAAGLVLEDLFYQDTVNIQRYRSIFKETKSHAINTP